MPKRLAGKVAVVTGGGAGIGLGVARRFLLEGATVAIWDLRPDAGLAELAAPENEGRLHAAALDVRDAAALRDACGRLLESVGGVDVLVNDAGITFGYLDALAMSDEAFRAVLGTNLGGTVNAVQAVVPSMKARRRGRILNVTSVLDRHGFPGQTAYVASKAAIAGLTRVWAREFGPYGITVNAVSPGYIETRMNAQNGPEVERQVIARTPLGRLGTVEDVAGAFVYLASDEAAFVTGAVLPVDGGFVP